MDQATPVTETTTFDASPEEVWEALTDPEGVAAWLGDDAVLEPREGGRIEGPDPESGVPRTGTVEEVEPARRLGYTWAPADPDSDLPTSAVTIELLPTGAGTRLVVTERPLTAMASATVGTWAAGTQATWSWRVASVHVGIWCRRRALV